MTSETSPPRVFSIGHSNHEIEHFLALLSTHAIEVVVDVRTLPRSGYSPQFDRAILEKSLKERGIRYVFLGDQLGGRPAGERYYDDDGYVLYDRVAASESFREGIQRLKAGIDKYHAAMLCSEENPTDCHRRLLVARVLAEDGVRVTHIRGDSSVIDEDDLATQQRPAVVQSSLFGDDAEEKPWRSVRPVSPRDPQKTSSRH